MLIVREGGIDLGNTGFPKGATLSHRNILNNGAFVGARIGLTAIDRLCIPVPLYHCFGDDFPMTVTGKVQKFAMREQTLRLLEQGTGAAAI